MLCVPHSPRPRSVPVCGGSVAFHSLGQVGQVTEATARQWRTASGGESESWRRDIYYHGRRAQGAFTCAACQQRRACPHSTVDSRARDFCLGARAASSSQPTRREHTYAPNHATYKCFHAHRSQWRAATHAINCGELYHCGESTRERGNELYNMRTNCRIVEGGMASSRDDWGAVESGGEHAAQ